MLNADVLFVLDVNSIARAAFVCFTLFIFFFLKNKNGKMDMCKTEENKGRCKKSVRESQHYTSTLVFYSSRIEKRKNGQAE